MLIWKSLLFILCFILPAALAANDISELILANGLKIIVRPDRRSPVVVLQVWYKVGSANEQEGFTGISHLLEHMMYRSEKNPLLAAVYQKMNVIGSKGNAYTSRDHTFYYHILGKQHLALAFAVEAERMKHLSIDPDELNIEKSVIREELADNISRDPYLPTSNALYKRAFQYDSYQFPVIGEMADQDALTAEQVLKWHKKYYTPDNATLVIVGDIKTAEVFRLSRKFFSAIKKKAPLPDIHFYQDKKKSPEKNQGTRFIMPRFIMPKTTKVAMILVAFKVPSIKTSEPGWEAYALDVLAGWLDSGVHSRLTRALVRDRQVAHDVFVHYSLMNRKQSLFIIEATPTQNVSVEQLEQAITAEIQQLKNAVISPKTLQKVKNQIIAMAIFERDSMYTQAKIMGQAESVDIHWSEDEQYISRIKAVTAGQVKRVIQRYIDLEKKFVVIQNADNSNSNL